MRFGARGQVLFFIETQKTESMEDSRSFVQRRPVSGGHWHKGKMGHPRQRRANQGKGDYDPSRGLTSGTDWAESVAAGEED